MKKRTIMKKLQKTETEDQRNTANDLTHSLGGGHTAVADGFKARAGRGVVYRQADGIK